MVGGGDGPGLAEEGDGFVGGIEAVDADGVVADEGLEVGEGAVVVEELGESGEEEGGGEDAGGAAAAFFGVLGVGGAVAAEHEFGVGGEGGGEEGVAVLGAFGDGFAEEVGLEEAAEDVVEGDDEVVGGDGGEEVFEAVEEGEGGGGGDVLHDDAEAGEAGGEVLIGGEELGFAVEDEAGGFAVDEEGDAEVLHEGEGGFGGLDVVDAAVAVGGDAVGVEFEGEEVGLGGGEEGVGVGLEEEGHERLEGGGEGADGFEDALAVGEELLQGGDGGHQIGHDDGGGEGGGAEGGDELEHGAVSEVQVHVEGAVKLQGIGAGHLERYR